MQDLIGTTAVCLLPHPVVFFLKKTKTKQTKKASQTVSCCSSSSSLYTGYTPGSFVVLGVFVIVSMSVMDTKVQELSLSWWCGNDFSRHKTKKKGKENNKRGCCYNLPAEKKWRGAPAKQRAWKRVLDQSEIPWMWFVVLVRSKPTVSRPV